MALGSAMTAHGRCFAGHNHEAACKGWFRSFALIAPIFFVVQDLVSPLLRVFRWTPRVGGGGASC